MDFPFQLPLLAEYWIDVLLLWLGFGTLVGLLARLIFPGREPSGPLGTILVGVIGALAGPLLVGTIFQFERFSPISPLGFVAALAGASVVLVTYRFLLLVVSDHLHHTPPASAEPPFVPPPEYPPPPPMDYPWPHPPTP